MNLNPEFTFALNPFSLLCFLAVLVNIFVVQGALQRRRQRGALSLAAWMISISFWLLMAGFQYSAYDLQTNIFWAKMLYFGIAPIPFWFVIFAWQYSGRDAYITRRNVLLLMVAPLALLVLVWTNELHSLIWTDYTWNHAFNAWQYTFGPGLLTAVGGYIYGCLAYGSYFIIRSMLENRQQTFSHGVLLIVGMAIPWLVNILFLGGFFSQIALDPTPMALTASGICILLALNRYHLFDVVKLGRDEVIESLPEGVIIVDGDGAVVDYNPAAAKLLGNAVSLKVGTPISQAIRTDKYPDLAGVIATNNDGQTVLYNTQIGDTYHEVRIGKLHNGAVGATNGQIGRAITIRDVTHFVLDRQRRAEQTLRLQEELAINERLRQQLEEAAVRDSLTGLFNRRFLDALLEREVATAVRNRQELCLMIFDIDHFKRLNDTYGHLVGDEVLRQLGAFLQKTSRQSDIVCRYGGEEFVAVLPNANPADILQRAQSLLADVRGMAILYQGAEYHITISAGISAYPYDGDTPDELLRAADARLYVAKENGRDQVCGVAQQTEEE